LLEAAAVAAHEQMTLNASVGTDVKFCGVDDPTCEACQ
jgi:ribonucleoside-diphosphate reductase alpha chain